MPATFVTAFNIGNKSDAAAVRAFWLALQQPNDSVAVNTEAQHAVLALHRMRQERVKFRVVQSNKLRGVLSESGEIMGEGRAALNTAFPAVLARLADRMPALLTDTLRSRPCKSPPARMNASD